MSPSSYRALPRSQSRCRIHKAECPGISTDPYGPQPCVASRCACTRSPTWRTINTGADSSVVNRKPANEFSYLLAHRGFGERILLRALLREDVEHFHDQLADLLEFGDAKAATRPGRSTQAHARRYCRFLRIEGNAVLVAGDVSAAERQFRHLAGQALGPQVH